MRLPYRGLQILQYIEDGMSARPAILVEKIKKINPAFFDGLTNTASSNNRVVKNLIMRLEERGYLQEINGRYYVEK
jgi:4-hydroxy-3-methylbut-2-enyl diphosphate reductase IspH|tara:strand:- start:551 stop:778 length:228 start_codon:yes stop_codon:yes gene_type:complete